MICPVCKKETSSILRICQNCNSDLEKYINERDKALEGTGGVDLGGGFSMESWFLKFGPIGGIILIIISLLWFFAGLLGGRFYFYPPILFVIGITGTISGFIMIKKKKELKRKKEKGEIID